MTNTKEIIDQAYAAFNKRNIDAALALMSEDVSWSKASEGGRVVGKGDIRERAVLLHATIPDKIFKTKTATKW